MHASRTRRWVWTVAIILVPIALFILSYASSRNDRILQIMGGTLLGTALVMIVIQLFPTKEASNEQGR